MSGLKARTRIIMARMKLSGANIFRIKTSLHDYGVFVEVGVMENI